MVFCSNLWIGWLGKPIDFMEKTWWNWENLDSFIVKQLNPQTIKIQFLWSIVATFPIFHTIKFFFLMSLLSLVWASSVVCCCLLICWFNDYWSFFVFCVIFLIHVFVSMTIKIHIYISLGVLNVWVCLQNVSLCSFEFILLVLVFAWVYDLCVYLCWDHVCV
jgi:hypothetical protein